MSGIYIHIPFCKQACHYCNFHFSTTYSKYKDDLLAALIKEISLQKEYLSTKNVGTIYFGGGTPSLLTATEINKIIKEITQHFQIDSKAEITIESNPDDLSDNYLKKLKATPVNRLSIGIQSFFNEDLQYMNRAHSAAESKKAIQLAQDNGFDNLSIDLIYGTPTLQDDQWIENIEKSISFKIPHVSCYSLTVEPKTALNKLIQNQKLPAVNEEKSAQHFLILMDLMKKNNFEHYEISNFCQPGQYAVHNTNYWKGRSYLGIGPSAHSFDGRSRQWNINNNTTYIKSIQENKIPFQKEVLTATQQLNEYIMTSLRTQWGCDLKKIESDWGIQNKTQIEKTVGKYLQSKYIIIAQDVLYLTTSGKLIADSIISDLFLDED